MRPVLDALNLRVRAYTALGVSVRTRRSSVVAPLPDLKSLILCVVLLAPLLSGCLGSAHDQGETIPLLAGDTETEPRGPQNLLENETAKEPAYRSPETNTTQNQIESQNNTTTTPDPKEHKWPPLEQATIRPGANIIGCTTNFVFRDPTNGTIFIGTAAHCVRALKIGDPIEVFEGGIPTYMTKGDIARGTLAYSGAWNGTGYDPYYGQDFALIAIDDEDVHKVHPAVRHYGGPTGLFEPLDLTHGERVLWYGSSQTRQQLEPLRPHEGYACNLFGLNPWSLRFVPLGPAVPGDSGSPVLSANGKAMGILTAHSPVAVECGSSGVHANWLALALDEASERGVTVELVTWELLEEGRLPDHP